MKGLEVNSWRPKERTDTRSDWKLGLIDYWQHLHCKPSSTLEMLEVHLFRPAKFQCVGHVSFWFCVAFFLLVVLIVNLFMDDENAPSKIKLKLNTTALLYIGVPEGQPRRPGTCLWCRYFLAPGWQAFWELTGRKARTGRRLEQACKRGKQLKRRTLIN